MFKLKNVSPLIWISAIVIVAVSGFWLMAHFNNINPDKGTAESFLGIIGIDKLLKIETACTDSDGGLEYYTFGNTVQFYQYFWTNKKTSKTYSDQCKSDKKLTEYYCQKNKVSNKNYNCPDGCKEGKCIEQIQNTCQAQGGSVCSKFEVCEGQILSVNDTNKCCKGTCKLPKSFDWREKNNENLLHMPVNQLAGDCYELSAVNALESHINLYYNDRLNVDLSQQMVNDCEHFTGQIPEFSTPPQQCVDLGCDRDIFCITQNNGLPDEQCDPYVGRDIFCGGLYQEHQEDKCCSYDYVCKDWKDRTWKNSNFETYGVLNNQVSYNCAKEKKVNSEDEIKQLLISKGVLRFTATYPAGEGKETGHSRVLIGYNEKPSDWKTIKKCPDTDFCLPDNSCKEEMCNPSDPPFSVCMYNIYSNETWNYTYKCSRYEDTEAYVWKRETDYNNPRGQCAQITLQPGFITCHPDIGSKIISFKPGEGDPVWITETWGSFIDETLSIYDFMDLQIPLGPFTPPTNKAYWPENFNNQINCVDKDGDNFCNWGISDVKPSTCPSFCKHEEDWDDSNPNIGALGLQQ